MTRNVISFDLEEYFQVSGFERFVPAGRWESFESRVEAQVERVLDILDEHGARATFFVLGWTAERHPELVREIVRRGHEVGSHGYGHELLYDRGPRAFRRDVRRGRRVLGRIVGSEIHGYRAPSFSIVWDTLWAVDVLAQEGFAYDSSIFPIRHDRYGIPGAVRRPYTITTEDGYTIQELPPLTRRFLSARLPAGGGGWFRLFPLAWTARAIERMNEEGHPAVLYLHPWELDPDQPLVPGVSRRARFRHFVGMRGTERKLRKLLERFEFTCAAEILGLPGQELRATPARDAERLARTA